MLHRLGLAATLAGSLLVALGGVAARADHDHPSRCNVPLGDWQPRAAVEAALEARGWTVLSIRSDDGCYKVRATNVRGDSLKAKYDPASLEQIRRKHGDEDDD